MRALRFHGPGEIGLEAVPDPVPAPDETLVTVDACGVCGSDLHFLDGTASTGHVPITLGHEIAGRIAASPPEGMRAGDPVLVTIGDPCTRCRRCAEGRTNLCEQISVIGIHRDGGLADSVVAPARSLVARPASLAPGVAATAIDAGATAYHAVLRRAMVSPATSVLIIGCGGLGTYGLQFARLAGAAPVIVADSDPSALDRAIALGADEVILTGAGRSIGRVVKMLTDGGVDVAIEFVGAAATVDAAVKSVRPGGRAVVVGVGTEPVTTLPPVLWSNHEYTLTGCYGSLPGDVAIVLDHLVEGRVSPPPTATIALDEAAEALLAAASGRRAVAGRLIVHP